MRIGCLTLDEAFRVALFNTAAEQMLGYRAREVCGKPGEEIITGLTASLARLGRAPRDGRAETQFEATARHKDGRQVPLALTAQVLPDGDSRTAHDRAIVIFQDARELEKVANQLQHLDRLHSLDRFAAGIVHEIRNPLAGISTNAQHMLENIGPADPFHEEVRDILADVRDIERVVSQVLDLARPGRSQVRQVAIEDVVQEVLRFVKMPLRRQGVRLRCDLKRTSAPVRVDVSRMKQVFFNMVRNACDAMPHGGELRVSTGHPPADQRQVRVEVADSGCGIAEEHLARIFEPFFSTHREGTGLGLAISRRIVADHGGRIEVKSRPGRGARFAVVLPTV